MAHLYHSLHRQFIAAGAVILLTIMGISPAFALTADEIVQKVQTEQDGQVLDLQKLTIQHQAAYRIKLLLPSGRVKVLLLDAASGKILSDGESNKP